MIQYISFAKMSGAGNDFVVIDNRQGQIMHADRAAQVLCDRRIGIGADGLLLVEKSRIADFTMKYYNSDGSYGGMCGNGGRCIAMFAFREHIVPKRAMKFEALDFVYKAEIVDGTVILSMKDPVDFRLNKSLVVNGLTVRYHFVNTGTAHCIVFMDENSGIFGEDFEKADITKIGRLMRYHDDFAAGGTNVNFIRIGGGNPIEQRTYERGVEDETLACGTGSVASSIVAHKLKGIPAPVSVRVRSGEHLCINFTEEAGERITGVTLEGSAKIIYEGTVIYDAGNDCIMG
jgi:diaminopimelate epimerase